MLCNTQWIKQSVLARFCIYPAILRIADAFQVVLQIKGLDECSFCVLTNWIIGEIYSRIDHRDKYFDVLLICAFSILLQIRLHSCTCHRSSQPEHNSTLATDVRIKM